MIEKLSETVELMNSSDFKDRFKAEYYQLAYRTEKLSNMLNKWSDGELDFTPKCPKDLLQTQLEHMFWYLSILERRADIEGIEL